MIVGKAIKEFCQLKGVPEQPTLVLLPLFRSWHKKKVLIKNYHNYPSMQFDL
jgi:hypothetical protein